MTEAKRWVITTSADRPIREIAKDLANAGLIDAKILKEIGCITGSATDKTVAKLRNVRGVVEVSPDMPIDVGPPGMPNTW